MVCGVCVALGITSSMGATVAEGMLSFVEAVVAGEAQADEIDDWVHRWHTDPALVGTKLWQFLGLTEAEYGRWVEDHKTIHDVLARRKGVGTI